MIGAEEMAGDTADSGRRGVNVLAHFEDELTLHLERANELGRLVRRANDNVEEELRRTREIADTLRGVAEDR
jgi:hypothetical protein